MQHDNTGSWVQQMAAFLAGPAQVPAFVQANGYDDEGPSATRYQIALSSAEAQGDLNLIAIGWSDSTTTVASITDTAGNNYVAATPVTSVSGVWSQQLFYAANIGAVSSDVIQVTFTAPVFVELRAVEYSGLDPTSPIDAVAATQSDGANVSTSLTTTFTGDMLVAADSLDSCFVADSDGYTQVDSTGCNLVEDEVASAPGTYAASLMQSSNGPWIQQMVAFKQAGAQGGPCQGLADGTTCNDGNACTQSDSCLSGVCTGSNPVTCAASDACHVAGSCDPGTGVCSNPTAADGTACNDGNACTQSDACTSGVCTGSNPVICTASDQCHIAGICDTTTGACSNPIATNGTTCSDGNACTQTDTCQSGVCSGSNPVTCTASDQCHVAGSCDPSSGACSNPVATNGTTCNDGNPCTTQDSCQNGACQGTGSCNDAGAGPNWPAGAALQTLVAGPTSAKLTWPAATGPASIATYTITSNGATTAVLASPALSYTATGLTPGASYTFAVQATDANGASPPAPLRAVLVAETPVAATIAPPVNPSVVSTIAAANNFIYSGADPIQVGVAANVIASSRAAVTVGRVLTPANAPLPGVLVQALGHPELGTTTTASDGTYALAFNGGGGIVLSFSASGYLTVQRNLPDVRWNDYAHAPDVILTPLDVPTTVDFSGNSASFQVARGTKVTDIDGTRTATLLVPPGTQATLVTNGGSTPATSLTLRETEYTVGANGPKAMPGDLPATSGYTYAVGLTADEAEAAGADVEFSTPIISYTDNFLKFSVGQHVPVGHYDGTKGAWLPFPDGVVIGLLGVANGLQQIDLNGDGVAETQAALAAAGITTAEQAQLAALYPSPTSLWRVSIPHFSDPWDFNWPFAPPPGSPAPTPFPPQPPPNPNGPCNCDNQDATNGSTIECQNGVLRESIPVHGTPYRLAYASDRVPGYTAGNHLLIQVTGATAPQGAVAVTLQLDVQGQETTMSFAPSANLMTTFDWNNADPFGRTSIGGATVDVSVGYVYQGVYLTPGENPLGANYDALFGHFSYFGAPATGDRTRQQVTLWSRSQAHLQGTQDARGLGLGGWTLDVLHRYDVNTRTLYLGRGEHLASDSLSTKAASQFPGSFSSGAGAVMADGSVLVGDNQTLHKYSANGTLLSNVYTGGPTPAHVAVAPDGTSYVSSGSGIQRVDSQGNISTVINAANSNSGVSTGDGGPASAATVGPNSPIAVGPDGTLYMADTLGGIRKIDASGTISTIGGTGNSPLGSNNIRVGHVVFNFPPTAIAVDRDGGILVAALFDSCLVKLGVDNLVHVIAGICETFGQFGPPILGGPATQTHVLPSQVAVGPDGIIYFVDFASNQLLAVETDGTLAPVAGNSSPVSSCTPSTNGVAAIDTSLCTVESLADLTIGPDKTIFGYSEGHFIKVAATLPEFTGSAFVIAAQDGTEAYSFDFEGRHLATYALPSGNVRRTFQYDGSGRLSSVTDANGNITTVERDASGNPTALVSPFGGTTSVTVGGDGYLASVTDPIGAQFSMAYNNGLLTEMEYPTGSAAAQSKKTYDSLGRILSSQDAAGHLLSLNRSPDSTTNVGVSSTTSSGVKTQYQVSAPAAGGSTWTNTLPNGTTALYQIGADLSRTVTAPDGTKTTTTMGPDPRFGMQAPIVQSQSIILPSGLTQTRSTTRTVVLSDPQNPLSTTSETDANTINGQTWTTAYNAATQTFTTTSPLRRQTTTTVDAAGNPTQRVVSGLPPVTTAYDAFGRPASMTQGTFVQGGQSLPRTWTTGYDQLGFVDSRVDPLSAATTFINDAAGRHLQTAFPDGIGGSRMLFASYDGDGDLTSEILPSGATHSLSYTAVDALSAYVPPSVGTGNFTTQYSYDSDGRVLVETRPDGTTIQYAYDTAGRLHTKTLAQGALTYSFDPTTGKLVRLAAPSGITLGFGYDGFLPKSKTWSGTVAGSLVLGYDSTFRVTSRALNGGTAFGFGYDNDNLMTAAGMLTLTRDSQNGRVTSTSLGGVTDVTTYDSNGFLANYTAKFNGNVVYSETVGARDGVGRITERTEVAGSTTHLWTYAYDTAGRLTDVTEDGAGVGHYGYDADDNRTIYTNPLGVTVAPTYDAQDRLITYGGASYAYGPAGELQSKTTGGQTSSYAYDALGNLLHASLPSGTAIDYLVDGENRRSGVRVNGALSQAYLYQGALKVFAQLDGNGNVIGQFVYGSKPNVPDYYVTSAGTYRILSDHLGSPRMVVNVTTGAVVEQIDYDEFGNVTGDTAPGTLPFGFAGGMYDQNTKLVRFGARDYDPSVGRWTAKDSKRFGHNTSGPVPPHQAAVSSRPPMNRGQFAPSMMTPPPPQMNYANLYAYAGNDPVNFLDIDGRDIWDCLHDAGVSFTQCQNFCNSNNTFWNNLCAMINNTNTYPDCLNQCSANYERNVTECWIGGGCEDDDDECLAMQSGDPNDTTTDSSP